MSEQDKTPDQIQWDVIRELKWDTRVDSADVSVEIEGRTIKLTGLVGSWAKKVAVWEAARRVAGVMAVEDRVQVKLEESRPDIELAHAVRTALEWNVFIPAECITYKVIKGVVTLTGKVDLVRERLDAERAVRNLVGVWAVINKIEIETSGIAACDVKSSIEDALQRHGTREEWQRIAVEVDDGQVTMRGTVKSWWERTAAINAAMGTPGVRDVVDQLTVEW